MMTSARVSHGGERVILPAVPPDLVLRNEDGRLDLLIAIPDPQAQAYCAAHEAEPSLWHSLVALPLSGLAAVLGRYSR